MMLPAIRQADAQDGTVPAFPGAEGFGMFTEGGRGGEVHFVTNVLDYASGETPIEGSLRAAVEAGKPRMILFRVSGTVELKRILEIKHPYVTIAGQSAPGDGIALKNFGISIDADDVVIRYLRIRPGDVMGEEVDAVNIRSSNVVLDHCSASWGTDETVSVIGEATNVTVQWCLISESLNASVHSKGEHGYGSLISSSGNVTIHHTIYAFHKSRSPRPRHPLLDFRNNVIYGWGDRAGYNADDRTRMNYVGNVLLPLRYSRHERHAFIPGGTESRLFVDGNLLHLPDGGVLRDWTLISPPSGVADTAVAEVLGVTRPLPTPSVQTQPAEDVLELLLADAGATRPRRDAVDRRIIQLIRDRSGAIIDSQTEVGGWPRLENGPLPDDADADGMDDAWEERFGLDPGDPTDHAGDLDDDVYTNLEEFLNDTDPTTAFGWVDPPRIRPASGAVFTQVPLVVTMTTEEHDHPIHFTTDGREPTKASARYEGPLYVNDDAHVRAGALAGDRPTTSAYAAYEHVDWMKPSEAAPARALPGLRYAVFEAEDWDEGVVLDDLEPAATGSANAVDFGIRPAGGFNAIVYDGWLDIKTDGIYAFYLRDDERSELRLDGYVVTQGRPPGADPGRVALREGRYRFHVRSLHEEPRGSSLEWTGPNIERGPIPEQFFLLDKDAERR